MTDSTPTCRRCKRPLKMATALVVKNARGALGTIHEECLTFDDELVHRPAPLKTERKAVEYPDAWPGEEVPDAEGDG